MAATPRIMASDAYYRFAVKIDAALVEKLGETAMIGMAAHWALFDNSPIPSQGRQSAALRIRWVLSQRYRATDVSEAAIIAALKKVNDGTRRAQGMPR